MQKKHIWLRAGSFLLLGMVLFAVVQEVLTPDWRYPKEVEGPEDMIKEFEALKPEDDIQALFVGASTSEFGIDPMRIYEDSGIATFNLSSSGQPIEVSYYLLELAFHKLRPKVVFFESSGLFADAQLSFVDVAYRYVLDSLPICEKVRLASAYARRFSEEKQLAAFIGAYLPIYQYHERWKELTSTDFTREPELNLYRKGFFNYTRVYEIGLSTDLINEITDANYNNTLWKTEYLNGVPQSYVGEEPGVNGRRLYNAEIPANTLEIFLKMKTLCEENGAELVMFKTPQYILPQSGGKVSKLDMNAIRAVAEEYGVRFLDFIYELDFGMDLRTDSPDGGGHLNYLGAQKLSAFFSDYLQEEFHCTASYCKDYDEDLQIYDAMSRVEDLSTTMELIPYLEKLSSWENVTVFMAAVDDMMLNLSPESRQALNAFGLLTDFDTLSYNDSFLAVKGNDVVIYEAASNQRLYYGGVMENGIPYAVTSCGWRLGAEGQIIINGTNCSQGTRGLNIVVYDNTSGLVLDSVAFDTYGFDQRAYRTNYFYLGGHDYLREYEEYLMKKDAQEGIGI